MKGGRRKGSGAKPKGNYGPRNRTVTTRISQQIKEEMMELRGRGLSVSGILEKAIHSAYCDMIRA